jgi:excisionase family DNA binding protein
MDTQTHTLITDLMKKVAELENKLNHLHNVTVNIADKLNKNEFYDVIDINEAAKLIKITKSTIYKLTMEKKIPHYKIGKGKLAFKKSELVDYFNTKRQ